MARPIPTADAFDAWQADHGMPDTTVIDGAEVVDTAWADETPLPKSGPAATFEAALAEAGAELIRLEHELASAAGRTTRPNWAHIGTVNSILDDLRAVTAKAEQL